MKGTFREVRRPAQGTQRGNWLRNGFGAGGLNPEHLSWPCAACPAQTLREGPLNMAPPVTTSGARTVSGLGLQSANQPRLSYAEMAEDYPRYPDIHDLDLTLLNPRMIVVSRASLGLGLGEAAESPSCVACSSVQPPSHPGRAGLAAGHRVLSSAGRHPIHEPRTLHCFTQHPRLTSVQPVQDDGPETSASGERSGRGESEPGRLCLLERSL